MGIELEVRNWMLEVRGWRLEVGSRMLEVRYLTSSFYLLISSFYRLASGILIALSFQAHSQSLESYQQMAAENNPGLQAKYKQFEAAMEKVKQVSSLPDPSFSFGYFIAPVETRVGPQRARFSLTQMFPWFGTLKAEGNSATLRAEAEYQSFIDARNELYYQVASAYYPLLTLEETLRLQKENLTILESYKNIATKKFENAQGTMVDVLRVDIMIKEALTEISILEEKKKPLLTTFNQLLNREETEGVKLDKNRETDSLSLAYDKDSLFVNHPRLAALQLKIEAMEAQEEAAARQGMPQFGVGLDYVLIGKRTDLSPEAGMNLADNGKDAFMPMVSMNIPLFRGKYDATEKEVQLMQEAYTKMAEDTENKLVSSYESTWFEINKNLQYLKLYETQIQQTRQMLNLLFSAYANEGKDFEEMLRMQQQLLKYELLKVTATEAYAVAVAELEYVMGD